MPREDHWLAMALSELYRLDPNPDYAAVAYLQAESMIRNQYRRGWHSGTDWCFPFA